MNTSHPVPARDVSRDYARTLPWRAVVRRQEFDYEVDGHPTVYHGNIEHLACGHVVCNAPCPPATKRRCWQCRTTV
jgi:hypothetical protein